MQHRLLLFLDGDAEEELRGAFKGTVQASDAEKGKKIRKRRLVLLSHQSGETEIFLPEKEKKTDDRPTVRYGNVPLRNKLKDT